MKYKPSNDIYCSVFFMTNLIKNQHQNLFGL